MQFEKEFLFYLQNPNTNEYYIINNLGNVDTTPTPTYLSNAIYGYNHPEAPENWGNTEITWVRSKVYWGLTREITTEYIFHNQAAIIIKSLFLLYGSTAKCRLIIRKYDYANTGSTVTLNDFFKGDLNFAKLVRDKNGMKVPVKEAGLRDLFTQNLNITQTIPIIPSEADLCTMIGIKLKAKKEFLAGGQQPLYPADTYLNTLLTIVPGVQEGGIIFYLDQTVQAGSGSLNSTNWFYKALTTQTATITVTGDIDIFINNPGLFNHQLNISIEGASDQTGTTTTFIETLFDTLTPQPLAGAQPQVNLSYTFNTNMIEGNVLYFRAIDATASPDNSTITMLEGFTIKIETTFNLPTTKAYAYREGLLFEKLVSSATNGLYTANSDFFQDNINYIDSCPKWTVYSTGDALREITEDNSLDGLPPSFKMTLADFLENVIKDYGGGVGIENEQLIFQRKSYFLNPNIEIIEFGEVSDLSIEFATDLLYNLIESGNEEQDYDELNGKDEFMNKFQYKTNLTDPLAFDLVRPFRYDMYGIEFARYQLFKKDTTDSRVDNQAFVWEIDNDALIDGGYPQRRDQNLFGVGNFATGLLFPTFAYNISKSPARAFLRNSPQIKGSLFFQSAEVIEFKSTEKNNSLISRLTGLGMGTPAIGERGQFYNLVIDNWTPDILPGDRLYLPLLFKFQTIIPQNIIEILNATPNGYFTFFYNGVKLKGFPMKLSTKPFTRDAYDVELLCHPNVSLEDLDLAL